MFNDEMESVRMNAVHSLRKVANKHAISLDRNQLKSVMMVLQDGNPTVRQAAYSMLG